MDKGLIGKDIVFALDIGTRSLIGTILKPEEDGIKVLYESYIEHEERAMLDGQIHDIDLVAKGVKAIKSDLEEKLGYKLNDVVIAAAGRFLRTSVAKAEMELDEEKEIDLDIIKSLELSAVKKAEDEVLASSKGKLYCVAYTVKNYYLNGYIISNLESHRGENVGVEVIATFLPRSVIDSLYAVIEKVNLKVVNLTLEPIAAMEVVIPQKLRLLNVALVDIGAGTSDIAISNKNTVTAFGMVPLAGDEITEAIVQHCIVEFNEAERIKRFLGQHDSVEYENILGLKGTITKEEILKIINPVVNKVTDEIVTKILELNGGKAPSALFLVGGGAWTPNLRECLAEKLAMDLNRIAIKDRKTLDGFSCDNELGPVGVTVLGIALIAMKNMGRNFIKVFLNEEEIFLFNTDNNKVITALQQGDINPKILIGRRGNNVRFTLNKVKKVAFGTFGRNAKILLNGQEASLDAVVKDGDTIDIMPAQNGKDAHPFIKDYVKKIYSTEFYVNDEKQELTPIGISNGERVNIDYNIKNSDDIKILLPNTIKDLKELYFNDYNGRFFKASKVLPWDYIIQEGDKLYTEDAEKKLQEKDTINIQCNNKIVTLTGKKSYIFVDIFNFIDFDLKNPKGTIALKINGKDAMMYEDLKDGDKLEIFWK